MRYRDELDEQVLRQYAADLNYRAHKIGEAGKVSSDDLRTRILEAAGHCEWCGKALAGSDFEIDHIMNLSKGGSNTVSNLALSCVDCNRRKGEKSPVRFAKEIIAAGGHKTALISRLLTMYDETATVQNRLFDRELGESQSQDEPQDRSYRW